MNKRNKVYEQLKGCSKIIILDNTVDYILTCDIKVASKTIRDIRLLNDYGLELVTDYIHRISESEYKLWELITDFGKNLYRTLFFIVVGGNIYSQMRFRKAQPRYRREKFI